MVFPEAIIVERSRQNNSLPLQEEDVVAGIIFFGDAALEGCLLSVPTGC